MRYMLHSLGNWKGYHRNIQLMLLANLITSSGIGMFMVIYNLYVYSLGFPETFIGKIISVNSLATVLIMLPAGFISDQVGRRRILIISSFIVGLTLLARVFVVHSFYMLAFAFLTGIFNSFASVSVIPYLSENSRPEQRIGLFSLNAALMMLAQMFGNIAGGFSADLFNWGGLSRDVSYQYTLAIASVIVISGLIPLFMMKKSKKEVKIVQTHPNGSVKKAKSNINKKQQWKIIFLFAGASLPIGLGAGLVVPYLNLYFMNRFHATNSEIGFILSLGQLATVVATLIGPALVRRVGEVKSVVYLQLLSIPFLILTGYTGMLGVAVTGFLLRQALMNAGNPIQQTLMMSKVDDSMKAKANSVSQMTFMSGWATMGPIATAFVQNYGNYWGYAWLFSITAVLYLIGSNYYFVVVGHMMRNRENAD